MEAIDLRSDTVTMPTPGMREAMAKAEVGDDVYGEDPTVRALEERLAALFGHEQGLFCPSGTMTNQIAIRVHTRPGDEVICDEGAHVYRYEGGGMMATSGCSVKLITGDRGRFTAAQVEEAINDPRDAHLPRTRLVSIEDTCNRGGGAIWDREEIQQINGLCQRHGLALHLDGARLFNALAVSGEKARERGALFDSISICLSKGLGAPVGSMLLGSREFIAEARRVRKRLGGGMRQAGILAAAGHYALDHHLGRLADDHRRARELGEALQRTVPLQYLLPVETNIVIARLDPSLSDATFLTKLAEHGVRASRIAPQTIRFVTHLDVDDADMARVTESLQKIV